MCLLSRSHYVYAAKELSSKGFQSPEFSKRNIEGYTTGKYITLLGVAGEKQTAYDAYVMNLHSFLKATAIQKKITCTTSAKSSIPITLLLPIGLPPICVSSTSLVYYIVFLRI
jgi:hypothetical protein